MNIPRWLRLGSWFAVAAWAVGIFILSSLSGSQIAEINVFDLWDKAAHFAGFGLGAVLLTLALRWNTAWPDSRVFIFAAVAISLFGATDEWHQLFTAHRSGGDLPDWLADSAGAVTGSALTIFFHAR